MRYRRMSALVHPDKNRDERAADAFQEVKSAYAKLQDEEQKTSITRLIREAISQTERERRRKVKHGLPESRLPPFDKDLQRLTRAAFARLEHSKQNFEERSKKQTVCVVDVAFLLGCHR